MTRDQGPGKIGIGPGFDLCLGGDCFAPEGSVVPTLRLLPAGPQTGRHSGEVFACSFTPDGQFGLAAGWDGYLRLWEAEQGGPVHQLRAGTKPLASCAVAPDGRRWLSGSM